MSFSKRRPSSGTVKYISIIVTVVIFSFSTVQANTFKYTGNEVRIKEIDGTLSTDDILAVLEQTQNINIASLDEVLSSQDQIKLPSIKDPQKLTQSNNPSQYNLQSGIRVPLANVSGDLKFGKDLKFQVGTGIPLDAQGQPDSGIRVNTGTPLDFGYSQARFGNQVAFPIDMLRIRANGWTYGVNSGRNFSPSGSNVHKGIDYNSSTAVAEDGTRQGSNNNRFVPAHNQYISTGVIGKNIGSAMNYYAVADSVVTLCAQEGTTATAGNHIEYTFTVADSNGDIHRMKLGLMHLQDFPGDYGIRVGTVLKKGQLIGRVGSTGHSSNTHIHMELYEQLNGAYTHINPSKLWISNAPDDPSNVAGGVERMFYEMCGFRIY